MTAFSAQKPVEILAKKEQNKAFKNAMNPSFFVHLQECDFYI
jgi:hypothetical protein